MKIETKTKELWKLRSLKKWDNRPWIVFRNDICSPLVKISELLVEDLAIGDQHQHYTSNKVFKVSTK